MDKSQLYIKMCQQAQEIQDLWQPEYGDWMIAEYGLFTIGTACFYYDIHDETKPPIRSKYPQSTMQIEEETDSSWTKEELTWLPRQDQLQEMAKLASKIDEIVMVDPVNLSYSFDLWIRQHFYWGNTTDNRFTTMEQLWLAYVMHHNYSKAWDGESWVSDSQTKL